MSYPPPPGPQDWESQPGPAYGQQQGQPQGQQPYGGYQQPLYGTAPDPYGPPPTTSGKATTSLVLGIVSMVCFGFLTGIPAIIVGMRARKEIRLSQGRKSGDGLALGGIITGIIGSLIGVALVALFIGVIALGSSVSDAVCDELAQDSSASNDCT